MERGRRRSLDERVHVVSTRENTNRPNGRLPGKGFRDIETAVRLALDLEQCLDRNCWRRTRLGRDDPEPAGLAFLTGAGAGGRDSGRTQRGG